MLRASCTAIATALLAVTLVGTAAAAERKRVAAPQFVRTIPTGETGWFSSPGLVDLTGDGRLEIVAPVYSTFVFDAKGRLLGKGTATHGRVYAPGVVADLDGDGGKEIVVGGDDGTVAAYDLAGGRLRLKPGWPASTCSGGQCPEARGHGGGRPRRRRPRRGGGDDDEHVADGIAGVRVRRDAGRSTARRARPPRPGPATTRSPARGTTPASTGSATTATAPTARTWASGTSTTIRSWSSSSRSTTTRSTSSTTTARRSSPPRGTRTGRAGTSGAGSAGASSSAGCGPSVEDRHYHRHAGAWPDVRTTPWLQWTASPPSIADLDGDGSNEVIGLPNVERKEPYETQAYAFMVLDGAQDGGRAFGAPAQGVPEPAAEPQAGGPARRRLVPAERDPRADGGRHPRGPPPRDRRLRARRGRLRGRPDGKRLWRYDYAHGAAKTFASEVVAADLNRDGRARARLRHVRPGAAVGPARGAVGVREAAP